MNGQIMKGIVASLAGMLVMACAGCGGGSGGGSAPAPAAKPQPKTVIVYAEGDSTMVGYVVPTGPLPDGTPSRTKYIPTDVMQAEMQKSFGSTVTVENHAIGKTTVADSLNGTAGYQPLATRLASTKAQVVIANFGINDQFLTTADAYKQNWQKWIDTVKSFGKTPVMIERNPICTDGAPDATPFVQAERDVAKANGVTLIAQYDAILAMPNWQGMLGDCMHPKDDLYQIMSQKDADGVRPVVAPLM